MKLSVGIVGLPNAGKSTLFNALLKKQVAAAENYPFCTIEPNTGIIPVPDERLAKLAEIVKTKRIVPATVEFVDIAGLVKGAHKGEGLGNKFLANIRETGAIVYVLRFFKDPNVLHIRNVIDPQADLTILEEELIFADLETLVKQKEPRGKASKQEIKTWKTVQLLIKELNQGIPARKVKLTEEQVVLIKPLNLLTIKPVIYIANLSEVQLKNTQTILRDFPFKPIIHLSAKIESELIDLSHAESLELLQSIGINTPALTKLSQTAYETLGLMSFLTAGELEARAWTIKQGITAQYASGAIHTDFVKKFIKADVVSYADFIQFQGWQKCREVGKVRSEGKEYLMQEGDVVEFKIGT